jgi:Phosphodiester glycosidase
VHGVRAVYETWLMPPGGHRVAGIAWMDTRLLSARLYSGSLSPGGGPYRFTAPVASAQARTLVAAFNGGFKMKAAEGGYYTGGRTIDALRRGAASLVIYANGDVAIGAWGSGGLVMSPAVASVRQNLAMLVADGQPTHAADGSWRSWGNTCGATSCAASVPGIEHQWRSAIGITADGALVYVVGPGLDPLQLARLLVRAGAVAGMQLDINPFWPTFAAYDPGSPYGAAAPRNGGRLLAGTVQGPATFFTPSWARDFITMSARPSR